MRIAIYASGGTGGVGVREDADRAPAPGPLAEAVRGALAAGEGLAEARVTWIDVADRVAEVGAEADCLVLVLPEVGEAEIGLLRGLPRLVPKVLVTEDPGRAALRLRRFVMEEIVGPERLEEELPAAVRRAHGSGVLERAATVVEQLDRLSRTLREWMARVLRTSPPPRTVRAAARAAGRTASTIRRHWEEEIGRSSPKEFLRWILLVRASALNHPGTSWPQVAKKLGKSVGALERAARDLAGMELDVLVGEELDGIRRKFEAYVVRTLLEE